MKPKITYLDRYNESLSKAVKTLESTAELQPCDEFEILMMCLIEFSQMWYKAKCVASEYCIAQFADIANGYAVGVDMIKTRISELFKNESIEVD